MGSSQEGPGASLSEVRDRGTCTGAWSLAVWGLASQQVQVTSDAEARLEGGWREGVAQGPESTGEKFGAYPDLRPGQGCPLGCDKTWNWAHHLGGCAFVQGRGGGSLVGDGDRQMVRRWTRLELPGTC